MKIEIEYVSIVAVGAICLVPLSIEFFFWLSGSLVNQIFLETREADASICLLVMSKNGRLSQNKRYVAKIFL